MQQKPDGGGWLSKVFSNLSLRQTDIDQSSKAIDEEVQSLATAVDVVLAESPIDREKLGQLEDQANTRLAQYSDVGRLSPNQWLGRNMLLQTVEKISSFFIREDIKKTEKLSAKNKLNEETEQQKQRPYVVTGEKRRVIFLAAVQSEDLADLQSRLVGVINSQDIRLSSIVSSTLANLSSLDKEIQLKSGDVVIQEIHDAINTQLDRIQDLSIRRRIKRMVAREVRRIESSHQV